MIKPKKEKANLGKALMNNRGFKKNKRTDRHTVEIIESTNETMKSIIHQNDLSEFVSMAELQNKKFFSERDNVTIVIDDTKKYKLTETGMEEKRSEVNQIFPIPRRPKWTTSMTREEVDLNEKQSFFEWRRKLTSIEEKGDYTLTPYEKNLNIWRQLWRVTEKSDLVCQILDARNPLLFRCQDLEKYISEVDKKKKSILIINKSDLLTQKQRFAWASYFKKHNLKFIFFSALVEQEKIEKSETETIEEKKYVDPSEKDWTHVFSRKELIEFFLSKIEKKNQDTSQPSIAVGMVGYPNVGKSSLINVLFGKKRVAVASTPGKTKHLQTLILEKDILLCDCPGLVFPSVTISKEEMVCDGILPIDELKEWRPPIKLIVERIPKRTLELTYGLKFGDRKVTPNFLLDSLAKSKGIMSHKNVPNASVAARLILKDYVSGRLLYCHPPPLTEKELKEIEEMNNEEEEEIEEGEEGEEGEEEDDEDEYFTDEEEEVIQSFNDVNINQEFLKEKEKKRNLEKEKVDYFQIELDKLKLTKPSTEEEFIDLEVKKVEKTTRGKKIKPEKDKKYRLQNHEKQSLYSPIPVSELKKILN